jgi:hypothetical protein
LAVTICMRGLRLSDLPVRRPKFYGMPPDAAPSGFANCRKAVENLFAPGRSGEMTGAASRPHARRHAARPHRDR